MFFQTLKVAIIVAIAAIATPAFAQFGHGGYVEHVYGNQDNCGRGITQQQAEGLWAGYCNESCGYQGASRGCGSCLTGSSCGGVGYSSGGQFGYSTGGYDSGSFVVSTGGDSTAGGGGGCLSKLHGGGGCLGKRHGGGLGKRHGGCGKRKSMLFSHGWGGGCCKLKSMFSGGAAVSTSDNASYSVGSFGGGYVDGGSFGGVSYSTGYYDGGSCDSGSCGGGGGCLSKHHGGGGLFGKHHGGGGLFGKHHGGGKRKFGGCCGKFSGSAQDCGTNGAYFNEAVGFEYGTSGMQSCVSCGCGN